MTHGFRATKQGWALKCRPEIEAEFYRASTAHGAWDRLDEVKADVEVVVGDGSDSHPLALAEELTGRFRSATLRVVTGASHFVPMEHPDQVARLLAI